MQGARLTACSNRCDDLLSVLLVSQTAATASKCDFCILDLFAFFSVVYIKDAVFGFVGGWRACSWWCFWVLFVFVCIVLCFSFGLFLYCLSHLCGVTTYLLLRASLRLRVCFPLFLGVLDFPYFAFSAFSFPFLSMPLVFLAVST